MTPAYLDAVMQCLSSTHALLKVFLQTDVKILRNIPVVNYVRMTYAAVVLTKLYFSTCSASSEIGKILDQESLQLTEYLNKLAMHLMTVVGSKRHRVASKFLMIILALKTWCSQQKDRSNPKSGHMELIEPCYYIKPEEGPIVAQSSPFEPERQGKPLECSEKEGPSQITRLTGIHHPPLPQPHHWSNKDKHVAADDHFFNVLAAGNANFSSLFDVQKLDILNPPRFEADAIMAPLSDSLLEKSKDLGLNQLEHYDGMDTYTDDINNWINNESPFDDLNAEFLPEFLDSVQCRE